MKTFACACGSSFSKRTSLDQHVASKRDSLCCSCNTSFKTRRELEMHARAQGHVSYHAGETGLWPPPVKDKPNAKPLPAKSSKYQCDRCLTKKSFSSATALSDHLKDKHGGHSNAALRDDSSNDCPLCDEKNFSSAKGVLDHINDKHHGKRKAPEPPISSPRTRSKAKPLNTPTPTSSTAATIREYCCLQCGRRFATEDGVGDHAAVKHKEPFQESGDSPESQSTQPSGGGDVESLASDTSDTSSLDEEAGGVGLVNLEPSPCFDWFDAFNQESGESLVERDGWSPSAKPWQLLDDMASPLGAT